MRYSQIPSWLDKLAQEEQDTTDAQDTTDEQDTTEAGNSEDQDSGSEDTSESSGQPAEGEDQPSEGDQPAEGGDSGVTPDQMGGEIDALKKELEEMKSNKDLEEEVERLKKKIENINFDDDTNLNDSIYQSASKVAYIKRSMRRILKKASYLTTEQQEAVMNELRKNGNIPYQQLAKSMADKIGAKEDDIFMFLTNFANSNKHRRAL